MAPKTNIIKIIARHKKAKRDFIIEEIYEAGLVLKGTEVKSLRKGLVDLVDSYATLKKNELFLKNMHIAKYPYATLFNHPPRRERKLLMKMRELKRLSGKIKEQGYTLIPLSLYFKNGWAKVELALAKGRKKYDKRAKIQKRELERELQYK